MSRHAQLILLVAVLAAIVIWFLWPSPMKSDQPAVAGRIPASEFERVSLPFPHPEGLTVDEDFRGHFTDASRSHHVGTQRIAPGSPVPSLTPSPVASAPATVAPSASPFPSAATPVRSSVRFSADRAVASVAGITSWFRSPAGVSAAGPELRAALGVGWRGTRVMVSGPAGSAVVVLSDWCQCFRGTASERIVDLNAPVFEAVCGALSRGICRVEIAP